MRRLWDRSKFQPNDFLMAVCGHDCESDSKMQYCRVFCYRIDETRCTVVSFNEKLIEHMHFPLGKQWFLVQDIKHTQDFNVFCKSFIVQNRWTSIEIIALSTCLTKHIDQTIVRRLWIDCESDVESSLGSESVPEIKPPGALENRETIGKQLWGDCESIVSRT